MMKKNSNQNKTEDDNTTRQRNCEQHFSPSFIYQSAGSSGACWYMSRALAHSASMKATRGGTNAGGAVPFSKAGQSIGALVLVVLMLAAASPEDGDGSAAVKKACWRTSLEALVPSRCFRSYEEGVISRRIK